MNQPINFILTLLIFNVLISCTSNRKELKSNEKNNIQLKNNVDSPKDSIVTKKMDVIEYGCISIFRLSDFS